MICFVDLEHQRFYDDPTTRQDHLARLMEVRLCLEAAAGDACLVQHYPAVTRRRLAQWGVQAVVLSGNRADWQEYGPADFDELHGLIRDADVPLFGICGGLQLIAKATGAPIGPMGLLAPGEEDPFPGYGAGHRKEWGFIPVRVLEPDPIFAGLGDTPVFCEAHYWEIKEVPPGYRRLASTDQTGVQVIRRETAFIYGTQFHPERSTLEHPAGFQLLANFFRLAGIRPT